MKSRKKYYGLAGLVLICAFTLFLASEVGQKTRQALNQRQEKALAEINEQITKLGQDLRLSSQQIQFAEAELRRDLTGQSPLKIRGGSFKAFNYNSASTWSSTPSDASVDIGVPAQTIYLDGVDPAIGDTPSSDVIAASKNWKIVLNFRKADKSEDSTKTMTICSAAPGGSCNLGSTPVGSTILFHGDGSGKFHDHGIDHPSVRYNIRQCSTTGGDPDADCNHVFRVTVFTSPTDPPKNYKCVDGECSIQLGP